MRRFALGCLGYTPGRFGEMMVGDFLDAMTGYNEGENDRFKSYAELVRISTTLLINIQLPRKDKISAHDLWPFPWDRDYNKKFELITDEERKKRDEAMKKILDRIMPDK